MSGALTLRHLRIELCERPVRLARQLDYILFGKPLAHPFLALIDENERVLSELHFVPYDNSSSATHGGKRTRLNRLFELSTAATVPIGIDKLIRTLLSKTRLAKSYPTLHSVMTYGPRQYPTAPEHQVIASGYYAEMIEFWQDLRASAAKIDREMRPYDRFGCGRNRHNCQTGLAEILKQNGFLPMPLSGRYAAPGWTFKPQ